MICRITLAINERSSRKELAALLGEREDVVLSVVNAGKSLSRALRRRDSDIVIISLSALPSPANETFQELKRLPEAPEVVLLSSGITPERAAERVAMGCDLVLDDQLPAVKLLEAVNAVIERRLRLRVQLTEARDCALNGPSLDDFISSSETMRSLMDVVRRVVNSDASLLIQGETGVGKERLARAIHQESPRGEGAFVAVNCAALPESLLESEMFGHERGAFTGAIRPRRGAFELAHKGTIFLDEIGDMPLKLQAKLLRALQEKEFTRVGGESSVKVDTRVMAATNQNLSSMIARRDFRQDLYYRINVVALNIPPLRERREDIMELAVSYLRYFRNRVQSPAQSVSEDAARALLEYPWPGNLRELINVMERATLLCDTSEITLRELPDELWQSAAPPKGKLIDMPEDWLGLPWRQARTLVVDHAESVYFKKLISQCQGKIAPAARLAEISTRALFNKLSKHKIDKATFKTGE